MFMVLFFLGASLALPRTASVCVGLAFFALGLDAQ